MNRKKDEYTVGIIGGMGPYATLTFFKCVLDNTPAKKDWDHLHIIIDNNPKIPSRTRAFLFNEEDPVPMMVESVNRLKNSGADFIAIPCNSAHFFLPRICQQTDVNFINMVDETSQVVISSEAKVVGLIAGEVTVKGNLYEKRLTPHGITVLQVSDEEQKHVRNIIEDVKHNQVVESTISKMSELVHSLEIRGADTIILGCTELPLAFTGITTHCNVIDSVDVLAKAVVRTALGVSSIRTPQ